MSLLVGVAKINDNGTLAESFENKDRAREVLSQLTSSFKSVHTLMDHRDLSTCLWALAKLGLGREGMECPKPILKILKSEVFLSGLKSTTFLSQTLWALSRLGVLNTSKSLTKRVVRVLGDVDLTNSEMFDCAKLGTIAWVFSSCSDMLMRIQKFTRISKSLSKSAKSRVPEMDFKTLVRHVFFSRFFSNRQISQQHARRVESICGHESLSNPYRVALQHSGSTKLLRRKMRQSYSKWFENMLRH